MDITAIDYKELMGGLLLSQHETDEVMTGITLSYAAAIQELEDALVLFTQTNGISNAVGGMLDIIGGWVGVERNSLPDEPYRVAILAKIVSEGADGTTENFLQILRTLTNTDKVSFFEQYPATAYAMVGSWSAQLADTITDIKPAGVEVRLLVGKELDVHKWAMASDVDDLLHTELEDTYEVLIDGVPYDLATSVVSSSVATGTTTSFGWAGHDSAVARPPMFIAQKGIKIEAGLIVDNEGNQIVDDLGNPINYIEYVI